MTFLPALNVYAVTRWQEVLDVLGDHVTFASSDRVQIETDDGAILCAHYFGPAEANEKLKRAVSVCAPTEFADQSIRSHWVLETGDPRYAWVNQTVFVGQGRLLPPRPGLLGFEHRVYRLS
ncbi:MAG: DUF3237 family protein [Nostoc sp.]